MIDFDKLRDPIWQAEFQAKEAARQAEVEAKEKRQLAAVDACFGHYEELTSNERSLVSSCRNKLYTGGAISEKQATWLYSIAKRFPPAQTTKAADSSWSNETMASAEEPKEPWRFPNGFVDDALYYWEGQQRHERLIADGQVDAANEVAGLYNLALQQELSGFTLESFARDYDAACLEDAARATKTLPGDHNMKSTPTPRTHVGVIAETSVVTFGPTGGMKYEVTVPAGTRCVKLDGGSDPWVVDDLRFLGDSNSMMYHDADHYGIRIPEENIVGIVPRGMPVPFSTYCERVKAEMHGAPGIRPDPGYVEQVKARLIVERIKDFSDAEVERCLKHTVVADANMRVLAWMVYDGLTIDKLYEGVKVDQDQIFNTLVAMGQDASLEDAKAISEKMTPQDHKDFWLAKSSEAEQEILRQAAADSVIRYVVTIPCEDGLGRELMHPAQGRHTYATPEEAQGWIDGYFKNNSADIIDKHGRDLQVRPCQCYPRHFVPKEVYFDLPEDHHELLKVTQTSRDSDAPPLSPK